MKKDFINISIDNKDLGKRLDVVLTKKCTTFSRNQIQKIIKESKVTFNDNIVTDSSMKINELGHITFLIPKNKKLNTKPQNIPLEILFEDENLLVISKPSGMVVHPSFGNDERTLVNALLFHCKNSLSGIGGFERPGIVHRLDKMTSGLILVAKNNISHINIAEQFKSRKITKVYKGFLWNKLCKNNDYIQNKITRSNINRKKMMVSKSKGKNAITFYKVLNEYCFKKDSYISFVNFKLHTGRTHQIRVHMNYIGNSLIGDTLYKEKKTKQKTLLPLELRNCIEELEKRGRQSLHASYLSFIHPITNKVMSFESPIPYDLSELKKKLDFFSKMNLE